MNNLYPYFSDKTVAYARVVLCVLFVLGGANYSHGDEVHHHSTEFESSHHQNPGVENLTLKIAPHSHLEKANLDQGLNEVAVHCGSPELQPNAEIFCHNMIVIGIVENCFRLVFARTAFSLEPPPPRS